MLRDIVNSLLNVFCLLWWAPCCVCNGENGDVWFSSTSLWLVFDFVKNLCSPVFIFIVHL